MNCNGCKGGCQPDPIWLEAGESMNIHFHTEDHILRCLEGGPIALHRALSHPLNGMAEIGEEVERLVAGQEKRVSRYTRHGVVAVQRARVLCDFQGKHAEMRYQ